MSRGIHDVLIEGTDRLPAGDDPRPWLICPNHVSWWDGFLVRALHREVRPASPLYTVMLEEELRRRPFLRWIGGLGLTPGSLGSVRALIDRLERIAGQAPPPTVVLFPQGRIGPTHLRPLGFQSGVGRLARALGPALVVPLSMHLEMGAHPAPTAFLSVREPLPSSELTVRGIEARVEDGLDDLLDFVATHGERAPSMWARRSIPHLGRADHSTDTNSLELSS
jgi:1-acyl-sn-glycerol-3-phosphate acyltransferase